MEKTSSIPVPATWQSREKVMTCRLLRKNINKESTTSLTTYTPIGILSVEINFTIIIVQKGWIT